MGDRLKTANANVQGLDKDSLPDVFNVVQALVQGLFAHAQKISAGEAAAFMARYEADSLEKAVSREVQMLLSRPYSMTDGTYMGDDYLSKHEDLLQPVPVVDDYTGQNHFHLIVANGTIVGGIAAAETLFSIVTYEPFRQRLLRGRVTGRFFCPYYGNVHFGATPLHFAVLTNQIPYVKLILEKLCLSDVERLDVLWDLDNSGNMVLHMAVMAGDIEIYDYLFETFLRLEMLLLKGSMLNGRKLKSVQSDVFIKNANNLTPLELAAALGKRELLSHMINSELITVWEYNEYSLKGYAMRDIDTFKTMALDRWRLAQLATANMRHRLRSEHNAGVGCLTNFANKILYGSLAMLVSKCYFESNVLQIVVSQKHIELCSIPAVSVVTQQKWEVFGRRLAAFWALVVAAVMVIFHIYITNYHNVVLSQGDPVPSAGNGSSSADAGSSDVAPPCQNIDPYMIIIMAVTASYLLFQTTLALMKGITFDLRPIDDAIHRPNARLSRLALLQQTLPLWDFDRKVKEVKLKQTVSSDLAEGLDAALKPFPSLPVGSSAFVETDVTFQDTLSAAEISGHTAGMSSFMKLLNVRPVDLLLAGRVSVCVCVCVCVCACVSVLVCVYVFVC